MKPINPGSYKKTDLKESSSRLFYYGEHQAPFALPVKILLKRKHRTVMTVLRPSNTQQFHQIIAPHFCSCIRISYNKTVIPSRPVKQTHSIHTR